jgi:hypothetical protein
MSSLSQFVGPTTASFIARVTKSDGGARSTLILFQLRSGSGSARGSIAMHSPQAKVSHRRRQQKQRTCQIKVDSVRMSIRVPMRGAPFLPIVSRTHVFDLILDLTDAGSRH